ncbi:MAG: radical SAM protein [Thermodesulfobacteriota bacterium]|nr:radical SAM protein [Thermodesulfobacteriota bacterium]
MKETDFTEDFASCELCEHKCKVNRLRGETGICRVTMPMVASATLHPAPPESYTVFLAGCNFKCLNCQNWTISQYPDNGYDQRGYDDPKRLAEECISRLESVPGRLMGADRIFFSGGEPTISLPYIEKVVEEARKIRSDVKVNFDTNGYMTEKSLKRILSFATSITYDLKAYHDETYHALTGASSRPVLRNAEHIGRHAKDRLWEYRILVIPKINEGEIKLITEFISNIDPSLPVCFLAFRPNFVLENHPGASITLMDRCVEIARDSGLENAYWSGHPGIPGVFMKCEDEIKQKYQSEGAQLSGSYALSAGCKTHPRACSTCVSNQLCRVKKYVPRRVM